jgi:uncharacterized protein (UPF0212 family)
MGKLAFKCPECGEYLSFDFLKDKEGKVKIEFYCEGAGDDMFSFKMSTGLTNKDIKELEIGKALSKEMAVELLERKSEREVLSELDRKRGLKK